MATRSSERHREYNRDYFIAHKEHLLEKKRLNRAKHKAMMTAERAEALKARRREQYLINRERILEQRRTAYAKAKAESDDEHCMYLLARWYCLSPINPEEYEDWCNKVAHTMTRLRGTHYGSLC